MDESETLGASTSYGTQHSSSKVLHLVLGEAAEASPHKQVANEGLIRDFGVSASIKF